ncbi:hypothetical protein HG535_0F00950 [Zygotorulaspora mrakii]|uniref:RGS domain-containing protein n=1 Tax=Zygotorulaspora mrakii TaxID=42260 RepID=A0A7H9B4H8_ZYGMR|nr:uncharacterized protein HG535_0F00950 [Zygotorulaspora mrakii]QLG73585.1 hypothetical protein HG535_0F00950 [Zygotorulaspora mrakii]
MSESKNESEYDRVQEERLPTLYEVLLRKSTAPLDSWEFYTYLSQFPYAIDYLDFWIDLMAHIRLCKDYIRGLRDSIQWSSMADAEDDRDLEGKEGQRFSLTSSVLLNALLNEGYLDHDDNHRISLFLQGNTEESQYISHLVNTWKVQSGSNEKETKERKETLPSMIDLIIRKENKEGRSRISSKQLANSAMGICNIYLMSPEQSPKYLINVPDGLKKELLYKIRTERRHDPEVFDDLKKLAYQFLEIDCFPKFLSTVALHNIHDQITNWRFTNELKKEQNVHHSMSPYSNYTALSRIATGLFVLGLGFWIGYVLIFLHYSRGIRVVTIVPFFIGCYSIVCGFYQVDILYAFFGYTQLLMDDPITFSKEYTNEPERRKAPTFFRLLGGRSRLIVIQHPFTRQLLFKRGIWCLCLVLIFTAILTVIFSCVPSYRL